MTSEDELYKDRILAEYKHPKHYGLKEPFSHEANATNSLCGDSLTVRLFIENRTIRDVSFENTGCVLSTASASLFLDSIKGKSVEDARRFGEDTVLQLLGISPTPGRMACVTLVLEAMHKML